ncbi:MAG: hypothetical protein CFE40_11890 [Burkholderiales bacterium PBB1]|nr:MAG: hypothetical protein CFE40_11890 [Burkholderiales bacterium PBB1]
MLRGLLLALLLANLVFFVWSQGGLGNADGGAAGGQREPERLSRQVHPEAVQLLRPVVAAPTPASTPSAATATDLSASGPEAASAASSAEAASGPATAEVSASAAIAASAAASGASAVASTPTLAPPPPPPPGTRCLEAGPFSGTALAAAETALAANAKTRRIARRWVQMASDAASAPSAPQHHLRVDATPAEVAVLEALPASVIGRSFTPCTAR